MNKNVVIESAYETIREFLEWSVDTDHCAKHPESFPNFVNGIIAATDKLLYKLEEEKRKNICKEFDEHIKKCQSEIDVLDKELTKITKNC